MQGIGCMKRDEVGRVVRHIRIATHPTRPLRLGRHACDIVASRRGVCIPQSRLQIPHRISHRIPHRIPHRISSLSNRSCWGKLRAVMG